LGGISKGEINFKQKYNFFSTCYGKITFVYTIEFIGTFKKNAYDKWRLLDGYGLFFCGQNQLFQGEIKDGQKNGKGVLYEIDPKK
jgi:hypothetical protein